MVQTRVDNDNKRYCRVDRNHKVFVWFNPSNQRHGDQERQQYAAGSDLSLAGTPSGFAFRL